MALALVVVVVVAMMVNTARDNPWYFQYGKVVSYLGSLSQI